MDSELVRILEEDVRDLENLVKMYAREKQFHKATECHAELEEIKEKLKQELAKEDSNEVDEVIQKIEG